MKNDLDGKMLSEYLGVFRNEGGWEGRELVSVPRV